MPTVTVGTNSYITRADCNTYLDASARAAANWTAVADDDKDRALISAFRRLDLLGLQEDGVDIDASDAPQAVKDAQCELAYEISQDPAVESDFEGVGGENIEALEAGSVSIDFFRPESGGALPQMVLTLIAAFMPSSSSASGSIAYGTDGTSSFDCDYGLSGGYA